jgi:small subunit ribosomal protein S16
VSETVKDTEMSVKIRLLRRGRTKLPQYDIVIADSRSARDKKFIEKIGYFHPKARGEEKTFVLNEELLNAWIVKGAQLTDVVVRLLIKNSIGPANITEAYKKRKASRIKAQELATKRKTDGEARKAAAEAKKAEAEAAASAAPAAEAPAQ